MEKIEVKPIDHSCNAKMLGILRASPIHANGLSLYFDKSPDIFDIPRMKYSPGQALGFFLDGELKGFAALGYYDALVQGREETVFSFYHFYLLPEARGKQIPQLAMREFFEQVRGRANYGISITLKGNRAAESYIGKEIGDWMPPTRVIGELTVKSILFALPKKNHTNYRVRNAALEDITEMVRLLNQEHIRRDFGLPFTEERILDNLAKRGLSIDRYFLATDRLGNIKGVCLAWDCTAFRRTRVEACSPKFYPTLLAYKTMQAVFPMASFPQKGEPFQELTITDYAVCDRDPVIMHALLTEVYRRHHNRTYHFMNWASSGDDPLLQAAQGFWSRDLRSHIIFTSMDPERYQIKTNLPYIDIAFI